jgi:chromosomal replication initiator protein
MQAWASFLETLEKQLGEAVVTKWLRSLQVVHFDACNLYLEAETPFQVDWFEEHIRPIVKKSFVNNNHRPIKIHLTCPAEVVSLPKKNRLHPSSTQETPSLVLSEDGLLADYTVENFVFHQENKILSKLFTQITTQVDPMFNPIFFYGESCTGKTHFLQAIAQELQKQNRKALYVSAETFTENVVKAIRSGNMQEFRKAHRNIDILLVDDVQHLAKKLATQEEFFHTFNTLYSQKKQIILSSNASPSFLSDIEPRLISRFEWGLSHPLLPLQPENIRQIAENRSQKLGLKIPSSSLQFLIKAFDYKPKQVHKALEALYMRASKNQSLSTLKIQSLLKDLLLEKEQEKLSPDKIVATISSFYQVPTKDVLSKSQTQECTAPRQMAMFLCRTLLRMPYTRIGDFFTRDHSTVICSIKSVEEKIRQKDADTLSALSAFKQKLPS